jgi:hypothetical protein
MAYVAAKCTLYFKFKVCTIFQLLQGQNDFYNAGKLFFKKMSQKTVLQNMQTLAETDTISD